MLSGHSSAPLILASKDGDGIPGASWLWDCLYWWAVGLTERSCLKDDSCPQSQPPHKFKHKFAYMHTPHKHKEKADNSQFTRAYRTQRERWLAERKFTYPWTCLTHTKVRMWFQYEDTAQGSYLLIEQLQSKPSSLGLWDYQIMAILHVLPRVHLSIKNEEGETTVSPNPISSQKRLSQKIYCRVRRGTKGKKS